MALLPTAPAHIISGLNGPLAAPIAKTYAEVYQQLHDDQYCLVQHHPFRKPSFHPDMTRSYAPDIGGDARLRRNDVWPSESDIYRKRELYLCAGAPGAPDFVLGGTAECVVRMVGDTVNHHAVSSVCKQILACLVTTLGE